VPLSSLATKDTGGDKSLQTQVSELWDLIVTYLKQETVEPIKGLGRFLQWGVPGALLFSMGFVLLLLGLLRFLQTETGAHLRGNWSWVPYLATLVLAGVIGVVAATRIAQRKNGQRG
jgi:hypothetical protein